MEMLPIIRSVLPLPSGWTARDPSAPETFHSLKRRDKEGSLSWHSVPYGTARVMFPLKSKGNGSYFSNCFYLKCLPKRAGDRRACLGVSHEECQQAGVAGRDAWCGPAGSVSVAGVGCQQPARAAAGSHVGGHGICTATAATCCVALLLRHYVEHTMSSPGKCCSLQLILSHSACVLCFRRRAVILEDLTPFLDGDIPSCTHHKVPEAHPSTVLKHCAMNREEHSWQSNTTPY